MAMIMYESHNSPGVHVQIERQIGELFCELRCNQQPRGFIEIVTDFCQPENSGETIFRLRPRKYGFAKYDDLLAMLHETNHYCLFVYDLHYTLSGGGNRRKLVEFVWQPDHDVDYEVRLGLNKCIPDRMVTKVFGNDIQQIDTNLKDILQKEGSLTQSPH
ncbi:uncharacterized protein LOC142346035 [Convolutriloba macropyga]|uniref:uncharacterized protein LOC142346035 n=1 Tax=Convolutriloba macropyga TaxID=536237 RepID=UPI003F521285